MNSKNDHPKRGALTEIVTSNSQNMFMPRGEDVDSLTSIVNMIPSILANLGEIESIPVTIQFENLSVSAKGITADKLRVGLNIIPKQ